VRRETLELAASHVLLMAREAVENPGDRQDLSWHEEDSREVALAELCLQLAGRASSALLALQELMGPDAARLALADAAQAIVTSADPLAIFEAALGDAVEHIWREVTGDAGKG
jgi:hypothetical protein